MCHKPLQTTVLLLWPLSNYFVMTLITLSIYSLLGLNVFALFCVNVLQRAFFSQFSFLVWTVPCFSSFWLWIVLSRCSVPVSWPLLRSTMMFLLCPWQNLLLYNLFFSPESISTMELQFCSNLNNILTPSKYFNICTNRLPYHTSLLSNKLIIWNIYVKP